MIPHQKIKAKVGVPLILGATNTGDYGTIGRRLSTRADPHSISPVKNGREISLRKQRKKQRQNTTSVVLWKRQGAESIVEIAQDWRVRFRLISGCDVITCDRERTGYRFAKTTRTVQVFLQVMLCISCKTQSSAVDSKVEMQAS